MKPTPTSDIVGIAFLGKKGWGPQFSSDLPTIYFVWACSEVILFFLQARQLFFPSKAAGPRKESTTSLQSHFGDLISVWHLTLSDQPCTFLCYLNIYEGP